jgi:hypothetical protein
MKSIGLRLMLLCFFLQGQKDKTERFHRETLTSQRPQSTLDRVVIEKVPWDEHRPGPVDWHGTAIRDPIFRSDPVMHVKRVPKNDIWPSTPSAGFMKSMTVFPGIGVWRITRNWKDHLPGAGSIVIGEQLAQVPHTDDGRDPDIMVCEI